MAERLAENYLDRYVETYWENGIWKSRRHDCDQPFATGRSRQRQIETGDQVARWNQVSHIIRNPDGTVAEETRYLPV